MAGQGTAALIDGAAIARSVYGDLKRRVTALLQAGVRPGLAAVLVGHDPASEVYVRNKTRACEDLGLHSEIHRFDESCSEHEVTASIAHLNTDSAVHGILVQLPLPQQLNAERVLQTVLPEKDVDGFHWRNLGALVAGHVLFAPCTPLGVIAMLDHEHIEIDGRHAVVIGRSLTVGKPAALMLIARGATVTVCNSRTADLREHTRRADILVSAAGRARLVTGDMIRPGAAIVDVGINRLPDGKLTGDVDFEAAQLVASHITPVPGGVGRMTVAMLLANTVTAAERAAARVV